MASHTVIARKAVPAIEKPTMYIAEIPPPLSWRAPTATTEVEKTTPGMTVEIADYIKDCESNSYCNDRSQRAEW